MGLGLEIARAARGRKDAEPVMMISHRPITEAEAQNYLESTDKVSTPQRLKKIRARHHEAARMIADGQSHVKIAATIGIQPGYIAIMLNDPAFKGLIDHYNSLADEKYEGMHERLAALGTDATTALHDRLEESPDDFEIADLIKVVTSTADRTGFGPSSKTTIDVNVGIANKLQSARENVAKQRALLDITPNKE